MPNLVLLLLALLVAAILVAPQIDLDPVVLPAQFAACFIALLLIWRVMTGSGAPLPPLALDTCSDFAKSGLFTRFAPACFPLRC